MHSVLVKTCTQAIDSSLKVSTIIIMIAIGTIVRPAHGTSVYIHNAVRSIVASKNSINVYTP